MSNSLIFTPVMLLYIFAVILHVHDKKLKLDVVLSHADDDRVETSCSKI